MKVILGASPTPQQKQDFVDEIYLKMISSLNQLNTALDSFIGEGGSDADLGLAVDGIHTLKVEMYGLAIFFEQARDNHMFLYEGALEFANRFFDDFTLPIKRSRSAPTLDNQGVKQAITNFDQTFKVVRANLENSYNKTALQQGKTVTSIPIAYRQSEYSAICNRGSADCPFESFFPLTNVTYNPGTGGDIVKPYFAQLRYFMRDMDIIPDDISFGRDDDFNIDNLIQKIAAGYHRQDPYIADSELVSNRGFCEEYISKVDAALFVRQANGHTPLQIAALRGDYKLVDAMVAKLQLFKKDLLDSGLPTAVIDNACTAISADLDKNQAERQQILQGAAGGLMDVSYQKVFEKNKAYIKNKLDNLRNNVPLRLTYGLGDFTTAVELSYDPKYLLEQIDKVVGESFADAHKGYTKTLDNLKTFLSRDVNKTAISAKLTKKFGQSPVTKKYIEACFKQIADKKDLAAYQTELVNERKDTNYALNDEDLQILQDALLREHGISNDTKQPPYEGAAGAGTIDVTSKIEHDGFVSHILPPLALADAAFLEIFLKNSVGEILEKANRTQPMQILLPIRKGAFHWDLCQITLDPTNYEVTLAAHDPYGSGKLEADMEAAIKKCIPNETGQYLAGFKVKTVPSQVPQIQGTHNNDGLYCGGYVAHLSVNLVRSKGVVDATKCWETPTGQADFSDNANRRAADYQMVQSKYPASAVARGVAAPAAPGALNPRAQRFYAGANLRVADKADPEKEKTDFLGLKRTEIIENFKVLLSKFIDDHKEQASNIKGFLLNAHLEFQKKTADANFYTDLEQYFEDNIIEGNKLYTIKEDFKKEAFALREAMKAKHIPNYIGPDDLLQLFRDVAIPAEKSPEKDAAASAGKKTVTFAGPEAGPKTNHINISEHGIAAKPTAKEPDSATKHAWLNSGVASNATNRSHNNVLGSVAASNRALNVPASFPAYQGQFNRPVYGGGYNYGYGATPAVSAAAYAPQAVPAAKEATKAEAEVKEQQASRENTKTNVAAKAPLSIEEQQAKRDAQVKKLQNLDNTKKYAGIATVALAGGTAIAAVVAPIFVAIVLGLTAFCGAVFTGSSFAKEKELRQELEGGANKLQQEKAMSYVDQPSNTTRRHADQFEPRDSSHSEAVAKEKKEASELSRS